MKALFNRPWFAIFAPTLIGVACVASCVHFSLT